MTKKYLRKNDLYFKLWIVGFNNLLRMGLNGGNNV